MNEPRTWKNPLSGLALSRTWVLLPLLFILQISLQGELGHAVLFKDTPIYHQALTQAKRSEEKGGLGLPEDKAKKFAMSVASHSKGRDVLKLFLSVFSHFDLEYQDSFDAARKISEELSVRPEAYCDLFLEAFTFANNPVSFLDATEAANFARAAAALPQESLDTYMAAYRFSRGNPYYMTPPYAILFANSAGNRPGMLERYRFAFSNILENSAAGFNASLSLAEELSTLSKEDFQAFLMTYYKARQRKQSQEESLLEARKTLEAAPPATQPVPTNLLKAKPLVSSASALPPMQQAHSEPTPTSSDQPGDSKKTSEVPASVKDDAAAFRKSM